MGLQGKKPLLLKNLLRTLLRSVLLHDLLGVHPRNGSVAPPERTGLLASLKLRVFSRHLGASKLALWQRCPQYLYEFHDQLWLFHGGGPSKKRNGTNRTGGSTILKQIWGGNLLYFPGFGDLQPYETRKFRICSESVSGVFADSFRILLRKCLTVLGAPPTMEPRLEARLEA